MQMRKTREEEEQERQQLKQYVLAYNDREQEQSRAE